MEAVPFKWSYKDTSGKFLYVEDGIDQVKRLRIFKNHDK